MPHTPQYIPLLHWVAPRIAHRGLIANNPWLPAACMRAAALFSDKALQVPAIVLASVNKVAIDYITQAPVLVVAAAARSDLALRDHRERVAARFKIACNAQPRLKDLMRFYGLAPQLRALSGSALRPSHHHLLKPLSAIAPSPLAQAIPSDPNEQTLWLATVGQWRSLCQHAAPDADWIIGWAASKSCHRHAGTAATDIIDFACRNRSTFDLDWSFAEASAACERWHTAIALRPFESNCTPEQLAAIADYGPLPLEAVVDNHTFVALRTREQIFAEGSAMHHCVASYAERVFDGGCFLYSLIHRGARVATLELRRHAKRYEQIQIKAHCNRAPPAETKAAAGRFLAGVNAIAGAAPAVTTASQMAPRRKR